MVSQNLILRASLPFRTAFGEDGSIAPGTIGSGRDGVALKFLLWATQRCSTGWMFDNPGLFKHLIKGQRRHTASPKLLHQISLVFLKSELHLTFLHNWSNVMFECMECWHHIQSDSIW